MNPEVFLPIVKIGNGVMNVALNANIAEVVIESDRNVKVTGSGKFKSVTVDSPAAVDCDIRGFVIEMKLQQPECALKLDGSAIIVELTPPAGKTAEQTVPNFDEVKQQISKVDGVETPSFNPGPSTPDTD